MTRYQSQVQRTNMTKHHLQNDNKLRDAYRFRSCSIFIRLMPRSANTVSFLVVYPAAPPHLMTANRSSQSICLFAFWNSSLWQAWCITEFLHSSMIINEGWQLGQCVLCVSVCMVHVSITCVACRPSSPWSVKKASCWCCTVRPNSKTHFYGYKKTK